VYASSLYLLSSFLRTMANGRCGCTVTHSHTRTIACSICWRRREGSHVKVEPAGRRTDGRAWQGGRLHVPAWLVRAEMAGDNWENWTRCSWRDRGAGARSGPRRRAPGHLPTLCATVGVGNGRRAPTVPPGAHSFRERAAGHTAVFSCINHSFMFFDPCKRSRFEVVFFRTRPQCDNSKWKKI
jgi:hypothetical protein